MLQWHLLLPSVIERRFKDHRHRELTSYVPSIDLGSKIRLSRLFIVRNLNFLPSYEFLNGCERLEGPSDDLAVNLTTGSGETTSSTT